MLVVIYTGGKMATQPFDEGRVLALTDLLKRLRAGGSVVAVDSTHGIRRLLRMREDEPIELIERACRAAGVDFRYGDDEDTIVLDFARRSAV